MLRQEQRENVQQSRYKDLPQPDPHYQAYQADSTGELHQTPQGTASRGDIYQPLLLRTSSSTAIVWQPGMSSTGQSASGKVAIPPLRGTKTESSKTSKKGRTSHACDACRKAKAGCSGGQPCARCRTTRMSCVYGDGKRDRERKELSKLSRETQYLSNQNSELRESLLRIRRASDLSLEDMKAAIDEILAKKHDSVSHRSGQRSPTMSSRPQLSEGDENEDGGEDHAGAEVGSIGSLDETAVDTGRPEIRGIGHLGKASAADWQHRTEEIVTKEINDSRDHDMLSVAIISTYHTEDADIIPFDTSNIDVYSLPDARLSGDLVQSYFDVVHNAFPIIDKADFLLKYRSFSGTSGNSSHNDAIWLITLNCVFAISAYYGRLTRSEALGGPMDHLIYCMRATTLCAQQNIMLHDAELSSTSVLGLLALYFLSTNRVNKSWSLCGLAFKHALALGLHVRSVSKTLSDMERENRVRLFWSLYILECNLNELTGRPACIADRDIGTPLPLNIEESDLRSGVRIYDSMEGVQSQSTSNSSESRRESRVSNPAATFEMPTLKEVKPVQFSTTPLSLTSSTCFVYRTQLTILSHQAITQLYCAATAKEKWNEIETVIRRIDTSLTRWSRNLPADFNVDIQPDQKPNLKDPSALNRTGLAMQYNASRMVLFRPCLCPTKEHIYNETKASQAFNQDAVKSCIGAARNIITILTWFPGGSQQIYTIPPFWNTLHHLCEALAVLLLELALKCEHLPKEKHSLLADVKKGITWLVAMSAESISARKAWEIYDKLMHMVAKINHLPVNDMPTQAPVPPNYNFFRQSNIPRERFASRRDSQTHLSQGAMGDTSFYEQGQDFAQQSLGQSNFPFYVNPLDESVALERFLAIGNLHGQFDNPWEQHFMATDPVNMMQPQAQGLTETGMGMAPMVAGSVQVSIHDDISPRTQFTAPSYGNNMYPPGSQGRY